MGQGCRMRASRSAAGLRLGADAMLPPAPAIQSAGRDAPKALPRQTKAQAAMPLHARVRPWRRLLFLLPPSRLRKAGRVKAALRKGANASAAGRKLAVRRRSLSLWPPAARHRKAMLYAKIVVTRRNAAAAARAGRIARRRAMARRAGRKGGRSSLERSAGVQRMRAMAAGMRARRAHGRLCASMVAGAMVGATLLQDAMQAGTRALHTPPTARRSTAATPVSCRPAVLPPLPMVLFPRIRRRSRGCMPLLRRRVLRLARRRAVPTIRVRRSMPRSISGPTIAAC